MQRGGKKKQFTKGNNCIKIQLEAKDRNFARVLNCCSSGTSNCHHNCSMLLELLHRSIAVLSWYCEL